MEIPQVGPAPSFQTEIDVTEGGRWTVYRRRKGLDCFEAERIGSSSERCLGLGRQLSRAVIRGDSVTILVTTSKRRCVFHANGTGE